MIKGGTHRLIDLANDGQAPYYLIRGLHAEDAVLHGPAVLVLPGGSLDGCRFDTGGGGTDALIWDLPDSRASYVGALPMVDCNLVRCTFVNVGVAGSHEFITKFLRNMTTIQ